MRVKIQPEHQIQRINLLLSELEVFKSLPNSHLLQRPNEKSWAVIEVAKHISLGHLAYQQRIVDAFLVNGGKSTAIDGMKCAAIPSYLIKRFPPQDGKIRFKMKTMKQFQPILDLQTAEVEAVFSELKTCLEELKSWVNDYRTKGVSLKKFNSAIGPMVRFNIPEACEFILCHNERHFHQMKSTSEKLIR